MIYSGQSYPETGAVWDTNRQIRDDGKETVRRRVPESKIVRDLVDGEEQVLIGGSTNDIGKGPELEGEEWRRAKVECGRGLQGNDGDDDVLGQRFGAA